MTEQDKPKVASLLDDHDPAISSLYRESAQDIPPTSLDDKIILAAHAAVNAQQDAPVTHKTRRSWPLLGGLAASVLVAVLAVKLLPYSLQSPAPVMKERTAAGTSETDRLASKSVTPPAASVSAPMPVSPTMVPEIQIQQDAATLNQSDEQEKKAERTFAAGAAADRAEVSMSEAATESPAEKPSPALLDRDNEFNRIVTLWNAGNTVEAIARFEVFQKQYPDFTPNDADLPVFQAIESIVKSTTLGYPSTLNHTEHNNDDSEDQKDVNESAHGVSGDQTQ